MNTLFHRATQAAVGLFCCATLASAAPFVPDTLPDAPPGKGDVALEQRIQEGLAAWRKPGAPNVTQGAACAACHAPNALDLAYFDFSDATLRRRAAPHHPNDPATIEAIVDLVHAVRSYYGIDNPRDPFEHRPFQPGGEVLPGATVDARDLNFARQLRDQGVLLATTPALTAADALLQREQILNLDVRQLKIGIPLNRWSEDPHFGPEHATLADWLPDLPRHPKPELEAAWFALQDAYLAEPTDANLTALMRAVNTHTEQPFSGNGSELMRDKYQSVLVAQHLFLHEVSAGRAFTDADRHSLALAPTRFVNPAWGIAEFVRKHHHPKGSGALTLPDNILQTRTASQNPAEETWRLRTAWFWLGWLFDQGLQSTNGGNSTKNAEYFAGLLRDDNLHENGFSGARNQTGYLAHDVLMLTRKLLVQYFDPAAYGIDKRGRTSDPSNAEVRLRYGNFIYANRHAYQQPANAEHRLLYQTMTENSFRIMMFLLQERLAEFGIQASGKKFDEAIRKWNEALDQFTVFFQNSSTGLLAENLAIVADTRAAIQRAAGLPVTPSTPTPPPPSDPVTPPAPTPEPTPEPEPEPTPAPLTAVVLEAEAMQLDQYRVENQRAALAKQVITLFNTGSDVGQASASFSGAPGHYDLWITYYDERDGEAELFLEVGGEVVQIEMNQNLRHGAVAKRNRVQRKVFAGRFWHTGDLLMLTGQANADEWARVDRLEWRPSSP